MARVVLSIGANLGDRRAALQSVLDAMGEEFTGVRVSPIYETAPWGGVEQPAFLNAAVAADTDLSPLAVLAFAQACETRSGRTRDVRWGPRTLDVDVVTYDDLRMDTPALTLPHPRAHERAFVLVCMRDLDADATIPGRGRVDALLAALPGADVRRLDDEHLVTP